MSAQVVLREGDGQRSICRTGAIPVSGCWSTGTQPCAGTYRLSLVSRLPQYLELSVRFRVWRRGFLGRNRRGGGAVEVVQLEGNAETYFMTAMLTGAVVLAR